MKFQAGERTKSAKFCALTLRGPLGRPFALSLLLLLLLFVLLIFMLLSVLLAALAVVFDAFAAALRPTVEPPTLSHF